MIYHVTDVKSWAKAQLDGLYSAPSLLSEGFIHSSSREQIPGVLERYYKNAKDLLLLHIDDAKLTSPLKYEIAPSLNELFPHIYGPINIDCIVFVEGLGV